MDINFSSNKNDFNAEICPFPYGKKGIFVQNSDTNEYPNEYTCIAIAMSKGIRLTTFISEYYQGNAVRGLIENFVDYDTYFATDRWKNPNTGVIEVIPDYFATSWTSAGKAVFPSVVVGTSKPTRTPNHGQQLFDISNGAYGYDFVNNVIGTNNLNEFKGLVLATKDWFFNETGRVSKSFSYRNGRNEGALLFIPYFLGGRNSNIGTTTLQTNTATDFGKFNNVFFGNPQIETSRTLRINQPSSTRLKDMPSGAYVGSCTYQQCIDYAVSQIQYIIQNGGMYNDFIHRSQYAGAVSGLTDFYNFLDAVTSVSGFHENIYSCGYGEALQYLFLREMTEGKVSSFVEKGKIYINVNKIDIYKNLTINGISQAIDLNLVKDGFINVKFSTSNTNYTGLDFNCIGGKISKISTDNFIITIHFSNLIEGARGVELTITDSPNYMSLDKPPIFNAIKNGTKIQFNSDRKVTCWVAYYTDKLYNSYEGMLNIVTANVLKKQVNWEIDISTVPNYATKKYMILIADENGFINSYEII